MQRSTTITDELRNKWEKVFASQEAQEFFLTDFSERKQRQIGKYTVYQDLLLDKRRAERFPYRNFQQSYATRPFKEQDLNFINDVKEFQIVFYLSSDGTSTSPKYDENEFPHMVLAGFTPYCPYHYLIPLYHMRKYPQMMTPELLSITINIMRFFDTEDFRLIFQCAGRASVNHFHLHLMFLRDMFEDGKYPIENTKPTSLKCSDEVQIEMIDESVCAFKIALNDFKNQEKLVEVVMKLLNFLTEKNIIYFGFLSQKGKAVYVVPKQLEMEIGPNQDLKLVQLGAYTSFGFSKVYDIDSKELTEDYISKVREKQIRVGDEDLKQILKFIECL